MMIFFFSPEVSVGEFLARFPEKSCSSGYFPVRRRRVEESSEEGGGV